ncbi:DNA polymerase III subunit alpha [Brevibacillus gelatini]|uniref:DNA-directed DNA polymerase n=1 Tax=Brevibacillus gelatini TaxID=1655277 RepID=A0A3M8B7J2_9BACL|nr:DNA polymerase III subunit alpha [Brevibacillus gelatini]RNB59414.1 DNA polymerase III subunit alpha [Brevibacillus gelatini]
MGKFSSLHNHTYFSLLDAVMSPEELVQQAHDLGFNAVAITEHGNMFSYVRGYKKAKELGIKFIAGCEVYETTDMDYKEKDSDRYHLILLAKSEEGLKNLFRIVSEGNTRGFYGKPRVDLKTIAKYSKDIIAMSACLGGRISRLLYRSWCKCCGGDSCENFTPKWDEAKVWVNKYKEVFGDNFYIELQSHDTKDQAEANKRLLKLAQDTSTKYTITFDTHLRDGSELQKDIHRKFIQIGQDREVGETYEGCWQTDIETIHQVMDKQIGYDAVEIGIATTDEIAEQCNLEIKLHQNLMPHIKIPKGFQNEQEYLKHLVKEGWKKRGFDKLPPEKKRQYRNRLLNEFEVLDYLGYCSYFIMLKQLIDKIRERNIPLGYSRGSGANCLTLYTLGVTEVDSIRWNLDFARFANKGRKGSPADYDIDISKARRQEALEIAVELFGVENVAQVATFNSLSPKVCIRDLGKIFDEQGIYNIPYSIRDKIAKLIPDDPNKKMTIERALEASSELQRYVEEYPLLFEYTKFLQNLPKSVGCHAAAVIIAPTPITDYSPVMYNQNGNLMMQMDMYNAMEDLGLVKMDFLGLNTLDVVEDTLKLAGLTWDDINLSKLNLDDENVYKEIYQKGNTLGVFQMEAYVAQEMFKAMKADSIYDIFAVNAMNRPAVLSVGMDKDYIRNKLNQELIKYIHDDLKPILQGTYGVMLYQEQALKVFGLAGFAEDEQDNARRAIGKKKADVMAEQFGKFKSGLELRNWLQDQIEEMWKLIAAQAEYSFNLGHSTAYGLLSYVTAWLKYYHPVAFMTALLKSEIGDYEQTSKYINECHRMGIKVLAPDINKSDRYYSKVGNDILFGFESIKGVGESATIAILEERTKGEFTGLKDFIERCKVDSSTVIALIKSGAFGSNKDELLLEYAKMDMPTGTFKPSKTLPNKQKLLELGVIHSDEEFKDKEKCLTKYNSYKLKEFEDKLSERQCKHINEFKEKYMGSPEMYEYETLSIFINGNPFDDVKQHFRPFSYYEDNKKCVVVGTITSVKRKKQKNGKPYAYIELLTPSEGIIEGVIFNNQLVQYQDIIEKGSNVVILATKSGGQFRTEQMKILEQWKSERGLK